MLRIVGLFLNFLFPLQLGYQLQGPGHHTHWFQREKTLGFKYSLGRLVLPSVLRRRSAAPHSSLNPVEPSLPEEEEENEGEIDPEFLL